MIDDIAIKFLGVEQLAQGILSLNHEQKFLCSEASNSTLSSMRLYYLLFIFKRYFIALNRIPHSAEFESGYARKTNVEANDAKTSMKAKTKQSISDPAVGLARVGSRAALNFSFAFLKRAWRLGEDIDLCSELLNESLDALRMLPVATLYDEKNISPVWLEVIDRSSKFLRQVVSG